MRTRTKQVVHQDVSLSIIISSLILIIISFGACTFVSNQQSTLTENTSQSTISPVLLSNRIYCISASDEDVWIATDLGVNRYTDDKWFEYTIDDGLADDNVQAVAVDGALIWFGTSSGLSRYNKISQNWKTFTRDHGLASNIITALAVDGNYLWVGTPQGLSRYNKSLDAWALHTKEDGGLNSDKISAIAVEEDYVWIATDKGVSRYDKNKDSWNKYTKEDGLAEDDVRCIAISKDLVWFGTYNSGVSEFSKIDQTFVRTYTRRDLLVSDKIKSIFIGSLYLWIGTANAGVQRYITPVDTWMQYTIDDGLASNHVTSIESQKRYVWFGTSEHGVSRFDKITGTFLTLTKSERLVSNNVKKMIVDGNSLWFCTPMGLGKFTPDSGVWKRFTKADGLVTDYITCVAVDDKDIWVGTSKGVGYFNDEVGRWKFWSTRNGLADDFILSIAIEPEDSKPEGRNTQHASRITQSVWVGTPKGLSVFDREKEEWKAIEAFAGKAVTTIAFDEKETTSAVWIGTSNGLFFAELEGKKWTHFKSVEGYVNKIVVSDGEIYACTQSGLAIVDAQTSDVKKRYTIADGLPSDNVRDVLKLNGELWLATPKGLCRLDRSGNFVIYELENTDAKMGHENVRSICVCDEQSKNTLWLATEGGLSELSIEQDRKGKSARVQENNQQSIWKVFRAQDTEDVLRHSYIPQILLDEEQIWSYSWHGTANGEIIKHDRRTGTWTLYTKEDIFGSGVAGSDEVTQTDGIRPLLSLRKETLNATRIIFVEWADADEDSVWFATNAGVLRYSKLSDTWRRYTVSDGLASNKTSYVKVDGDYVWVRLNEPRICWYNKKTEEWNTKVIASKESWSNPRKIATDERYVWITNGWDGISRYDKKDGSWKKYTMNDGLVGPSLENTVITENYVWVEDGAVNRYDYGTDLWATIDGTTGLARTGGIRDISDGRDYLWILYYSWRRGYDRGDRVPVAASGYHKKNGTWQTFRGNPETVGNDFVSVREADDVVWFASDDHGLSRYDKASGSWTVYTKDDGLLSNDINDNTLQVDERYVWAGTRDGLSRYDTVTGAWTSYTGRDTLISNRVRTIAADGRYIWCGTEDGLSRYDKRYNEWTNFRAHRGWRGGGDDFFMFFDVEGLSDNNVTSIAVDQKYVWVGTQDEMNRYDKSANRWDTYDRRNGLPDDVIRAVVVGKNDVWIGTPDGVAKYARLSDDPNAWETFGKTIEVEAGLVSEKFAKSLTSDDIRCLYLDDRYLWCGTKKGISRYDTSKEIWEGIKPAGKPESQKNENEIRNTKHETLANTSKIAVDGDTIWFGSDKGVTRWAQKSNTWKRYTKSDGLASENVTDIAVTEDSIWFATFDSGVSRYFKKSGKWQTFSKKDGLSHNSVFSIAVDDSTFSSLVGRSPRSSRFRKQEDHPVDENKSDGNKGKILWFGTELGLSRYDTVTDTWTVFTANFDEESY